MSAKPKAAQAAELTAERAPRYRFEIVLIEEIVLNPDNVRDEIVFEPGFLESLRTNGVMNPVKLTRNPADPEAPARFLVDGHRRVAGLREVGITLVPALIAEDMTEADVFEEMVLTSVHKAKLSAVEEAAGLFKANKAGASRKRLEGAAGRKRTEAAMKFHQLDEEARATVAAVDYAWTLEELAAFAEFADDAEATARLVRSAERKDFRHALQRERGERERREASAKQRQELTAAGIRIVDELPKTALEVRRLRTPQNAAISQEEHQACPGHIAHFHSDTAAALFYCTDSAAYGHQDAWKSNSRTVPADENQARANRKNVIEGNKHQDAAEVVRREWLTAYLRKSLTAAQAEALARFAAEAYLVSPAPIVDGTGGSEARRKMLAEFLGLATDTKEAAAQAAATVNARRLTALQFAPVAVSYELAFKRDTWRTDGDHRNWNGPRRRDARRWLEFLVSLGYTPSALETAIIQDSPYVALTDEADIAALAGSPAGDQQRQTAAEDDDQDDLAQDEPEDIEDDEDEDEDDEPEEEDQD